jgi:hypothetical protein
MQRGYVKLWRKSLDAGWISNHKLWVFWTWCLMKATHQEYDQIVGCQTVHLFPGQFIFGLKAAAKELKLSIQSIRTLLDFLKTSQNLTIKPTNKFSIISIINWSTYQGQDDEINTQSNKRLTNKQQTTNNKQEHKNINTKEYIIYGEHKNLKLTNEEHLKLRSSYGDSLTEKAIQYLSNYKIEKNYKTKSDYLTLKRWVFDAVKERENKNAATNSQGCSTNPYRRNNHDRPSSLTADDNAELDKLAADYYKNKAAVHNAG